MRNAVIVVLTLVIASVFTLELPMETAPGRCPRPKTVSNFQPAKLAGRWYDIKRYKNTILKGSCSNANYTWYPNNSSMTIPYEMMEFDTNTLVLTELDVPNGKFKTSVNGVPTPFDYWVIGTDYENFHIIYTCIELIPLILNSQTVNIYSREPTLAREHLSLALAIVADNRLDTTILRDVEQNSTICGRD